MKTAEVIVYLEGETDPPELEIDCPVCGAAGGLWCGIGAKVCIGGTMAAPLYGQLGVVHAKRRETDEERIERRQVEALAQVEAPQR